MRLVVVEEAIVGEAASRAREGERVGKFGGMWRAAKWVRRKRGRAREFERKRVP